MKKAMWNVDPSGHFQFSDKFSMQWKLFGVHDQPWLANRLAEIFAGSTRSIAEVRDFVLTETPCHSYTKALRILEGESRIEAVNEPARRRKGTFGNLANDPDFLLHFRTRPSGHQTPQQRSLF